MGRDAKQLVKDFPFTYTHQRSTLHFSTPITPHVADAMKHLLNQARQDKRVSAPVLSSGCRLFAKRQPIDTFKKKIRIARGRAKRCGMYDWPIEELMNTAEAQRRGVRVPSLIAFGYTRSPVGLANDVIIITELLPDHTDGLKWVNANPHRVEHLIAKAFELLQALNSKGIIHMDLWAANVMLANTGDAPAHAIDLENCFLKAPEDLSETLGFQFGFFYHREIYRFITEARYDALVYGALNAYPAVDKSRFAKVYEESKHQHIGRKERRGVIYGEVVVG